MIDGGRGLDLIVSNSNEIQIAAPPYDLRNTPTGKGSFSGFGDWAFLRVKQQLASRPASSGDYFVTVWLQVQAPTGIGPLTSSAWTYLPTLAVGKGWGDFDIQATIAAVLPASNIATVGDQIQTNIAFQYHLLKIFWPEFEVNWTYYASGQRGGLNQVFLTPGLVIGRFQLTDGFTFTTGIGYQVAVAPEYRPKPLTPAYSNSLPRGSTSDAWRAARASRSEFRRTSLKKSYSKWNIGNFPISQIVDKITVEYCYADSARFVTTEVGKKELGCEVTNRWLSAYNLPPRKWH